ncbi:MAG TPA: polysaccharide deacetylase family protein [Vicinamibacteria bacterium]|nr:polysaccharide deacetylase family protein [Vicinamibacteria bacterium]
MSTRRPEGLRVLTYHRVNDTHAHDRLTVHPQLFAAQMEALARSGRPVIDLAQALPPLRGNGPLPEGALALTFDDGFEDNFTVASPILERFGLRATFFIATGYVGAAGTLDRYRRCCSADRILDWNQVRALQTRGHAIGGHSRTHRELALLTPTEALGEAEGCAQDIEAETGERPRLFCYPRGSENAEVRRLVGRAGFEAACTVRPGANPVGIELLALRRTEVSGQDTIEDFRLKLAGGFDAWHGLVQRVAGWRAR